MNRTIEVDRSGRLIDLLPLENPLAIAIDPSNLCNFHCEFCPTGDKLLTKLRPNGIMPLELFKKIIDDVSDMGVKLKALKLWKDGEPFVNKDIIKFIEYAQKKGVAEQIRITSNGALLDRFAQPLVDVGLDWLMISFLSLNEEIYLRHSGRGKMREIIFNNVRILRELRDKRKSQKPYIAIKMCKFPYVTQQEIASFKDQFELFVDEIVLHEEPMDWDSSHHKDLTLGAGVQRLRPKKVCPFAWYQVNINFNGEVSICPVDWSFKTIIGDVSKEHFADIWRGKKMQDFRAMWAKQELFKNPVCEKCTYYFHHGDNIDDFVLERKAPFLTKLKAYENRQ